MGANLQMVTSEFDEELLTLVSSMTVYNSLEAVMRLRALTELCAALDTNALLRLAADVSVTRN